VTNLESRKTNVSPFLGNAVDLIPAGFRWLFATVAGEMRAMKTIPRSLALLTTLLIWSSANARIGENQSQIEARYGKPVKIFAAAEPPRPALKKMYKSDGIVIIVGFLNGVSESEYYSKPNAKIDRTEVETLLQANAQGKEWKQIPRGHSMYSSKGQRWMLGEISMSSTLADYNEVRGRLHILTKTYLDTTTAAEKAAATAKLKKF
jgi:hypothetical protein